MVRIWLGHSTNAGDSAQRDRATRKNEPRDFRSVELTLSCADEPDSNCQGCGSDQNGARIKQSAQRAHVGNGEKSARNQQRRGNGRNASRPKKRRGDGRHVECNLQEQGEQGEDSRVGMARSVKRDLVW